jgi:Holliday junction DNA helicase RuvA
MALPILASASVEGIMDAIERENVLYLKKFPKIGDKLAKQIILDLKGKLGVITNNIEEDKTDELIEVLKGLGYKEKEIKGIVPKIDKELPIEEQVKQALKLFLK